MRWAAELLKHVIAAFPDDRGAKLLQGDVFEQLGYQAESGPWRNFYLLAAAELRGTAQPVGTFQASNAEMSFGMNLAMLLDFVAIRLNGPRASGQRIVFAVRATDRDDAVTVTVERGVLRHEPGAHTASALSAPHAVLARLSLGSLTLDGALTEGARITGDETALRQLFSLLDDFAGDFAVTGSHREPSPA